MQLQRIWLLATFFSLQFCAASSHESGMQGREVLDLKLVDSQMSTDFHHSSNTDEDYLDFNDPYDYKNVHFSRQLVDFECDQHCSVCDTTTGNCTTCEERYEVDSNKTDCICLGNQVENISGDCLCSNDNTKYWSNTDQNCISCEKWCDLCNDATGVCQQCQDVDRMEFDIENLKQCICTGNQTKTDSGCSCDSGQYWSPSAGNCVPCDKFCALCDEATGVCSVCDLDTQLLSITNNKECVCKDSYYEETDQCLPCIDLCSTCSSSTVCSTCISNASIKTGSATCTCDFGYGKLGPSCVQCATLCLECTNSAAVCTSCTSNAVLASGVCSCTTGFYRDGSICRASCNQLCTTCSIENGNECSACVANAELVGSTCSCTSNSIYDPVTTSCVCSVGYSNVSSKCISCKNYYQLSDVLEATFDSTYSSITVKFSSPILDNIDFSCAKALDSRSLEKLGTGFVCSISGVNLRIQLGLSYSIRVETLYLDGTYLVKKQAGCNTNYTPLFITTKRANNDPSAKAAITGLENYSVADCSSRNLIYSASKSSGNYNSALTFQWSSEISPANPALSSYISSQTSSSFDIAKSYFPTSSGTLRIILTVTNGWDFSDTASIVTSVVGTPSLSVIIDVGNTDSMKNSDSREYRARVADFCSSTPTNVAWQWEYIASDSNPIFDSSTLLKASKVSSRLVINKNILPAGYSYRFNAIATSTLSTGVINSGFSSIIVTVTSSPLIATLSRSGGSVARNSDFNINGNASRDPDDPSAILDYE